MDINNETLLEKCLTVINTTDYSLKDIVLRFLTLAIERSGDDQHILNEIKKAYKQKHNDVFTYAFKPIRIKTNV